MRSLSSADAMNALLDEGRLEGVASDGSVSGQALLLSGWAKPHDARSGLFTKTRILPTALLQEILAKDRNRG